MPSLVSEHSLPPDQLSKLKSLLATEEIRILAKEAGGNSKVFCVEAEGKRWAVKSYPPYAPGQRDRLAAEVSVYQFLNEQGVPAVPMLKTGCINERWLIIDWIEGEIPRTYAAKDIEQAIQFIRSIAQLNILPLSKELPLAAEACLSLNILLEQIQRRYQRLLTEAEPELELNDFLTNHFLPVLEKYRNQALTYFQLNEMDPAAELSQPYRSLIPADFGFHNTLRNSAGELTFFDFDYFGWDDPVKLLADILWHPKMRLSEKQKQLFIHGFSDIYQSDPLFLSRFHSTWPLFGLRWVLILLNEFIPAFWQNRQHAEAHHNQIDAKKEQLKRATELLTKVQQIGCPYELITATSI